MPIQNCKQSVIARRGKRYTETGLSNARSGNMINCFQFCFQIKLAPLHRGLSTLEPSAHGRCGVCELGGGRRSWCEKQGGGGQGLTLVHFSAQPKPFWSHLPVSHCLIDWGKPMHPTYPTKYAHVESKSGRGSAPGRRRGWQRGRGRQQRRGRWELFYAHSGRQGGQLEGWLQWNGHHPQQ